MAGARLWPTAPSGGWRASISRPWATGSRSSRPSKAPTRAFVPSCRAGAAFRAGPPAIRPKSRSSRPTSIRCSSSAGLDGDFNPRRIERYLVVAADSGATPVVVLNKVDLVADLPADPRRKSAPWPRRVDVHAVSCRRPESLDALRRYLGHGQTGALLGSSGVGKSSIVNQLIGHELLRTREVRASDSRGRHTSTARQLVMLPGQGVLIDTPGMRELQLWDSGEAAGGDVHRHRGAARPIAGFAIASTAPSPGAPSAPPSRPGRSPRCGWRATTSSRASRPIRHGSRTSARCIEEKRRGKIGAKALRKRLEDKGRR